MLKVASDLVLHSSGRWRHTSVTRCVALFQGLGEQD